MVVSKLMLCAMNYGFFNLSQTVAVAMEHGYRALNAVNMEEKKISNSLQRTLHFDYVQQFLSQMN